MANEVPKKIDRGNITEHKFKIPHIYTYSLSRFFMGIKSMRVEGEGIYMNASLKLKWDITVRGGVFPWERERVSGN